MSPWPWVIADLVPPRISRKRHSPRLRLLVKKVYSSGVAFWRRKEQRSLISVSDPALAAWFGATPGYSGVIVGESTALSLSAVWRAVSLISGTIAQLPLRTLRDVDGTRTRVNSFLDNPGGPDGPTPFEWTETVLVHLLLHGNAFLAHVYNGGGAIVALVPVHPLCVSVRAEPAAPGR